MSSKAVRIFSLMFLAAVPYESAHAVDLDEALTVGGSILAVPRWTNAGSTTITSLSFAFSGVASGTANADVDSATQTIRLQTAVSYPATINVELPSTCKIGTRSVVSADIQLLKSGTLQTAVVSIPNDSNQDFFLRFTRAGLYGAAAGAVTCAIPGYLRYVY